MFSIDRFRRFGKGCCRFKNWDKGQKYQGRMDEEGCRKKCKHDKNCFAFDLSEGDHPTNPSTYDCHTYTGNGVNFRTGRCDDNQRVTDEICYADFSKIDIRGKKTLNFLTLMDPTYILST